MANKKNSPKNTNMANIEEVLNEFLEIAQNAQKEYEKLTHNFNSILEQIPHAIWVFEGDKLYYRNEKALKTSHIISNYTPAKILELDNKELQYNEEIYLINTRIVKENMIFILATDITQQKIEERYTAMGKIALHLAHEIRTPLASIALLNSSLEKSKDIKNQEIAKLMKQATKMLENIVNSILNFTKDTSIEKEIFTLEDLQQDIQNNLKNFVNHHVAKVSFKGFKGNILADKTLIEIVLNNFISNAFDSIEERIEEGGSFVGKIDLKITKNRNKIQIHVRDNGSPFNDADVLFEPFFTTKLKGTGLGLALCKQIITAHGGSISLQNKEKKEFLIIIENDL